MDFTELSSVEVIVSKFRLAKAQVQEKAASGKRQTQISRSIDEAKRREKGPVRETVLRRQETSRKKYDWTLTTSIICMSVRPKLSPRGSDSLPTGRSSTLYVSSRSFSSRFSW
jgi:hypothetical protein